QGRPNTLFMQADAQKFAVSPHSFDLAVSFETIEHVDQHDNFLRAIKMSLSKDGLLIISTPNPAVYTEQAHYHNPYHKLELDKGEFVKLLRRYFKHVRLLGQKLTVNSLIASTKANHFLECGEKLQAVI